MFVVQASESMKESIPGRSPFSVGNVEKPFSIITNFLDTLESMLARTLMNVPNVENALLMVETLKYIKELTLLINLKNVERPSVENQAWFDMLNLILLRGLTMQGVCKAFSNSKLVAYHRIHTDLKPCEYKKHEKVEMKSPVPTREFTLV